MTPSAVADIAPYRPPTLGEPSPRDLACAVSCLQSICAELRSAWSGFLGASAQLRVSGVAASEKNASQADITLPWQYDRWAGRCALPPELLHGIICGALGYDAIPAQASTPLTAIELQIAQAALGPIVRRCLTALGTGDSATVTWPAKAIGAAGADFTVSLGVSAAGTEGMLAIIAPLDMLRRGDEDESRAVWERLQETAVRVEAEADGPDLMLGDLAGLEAGDVALLRGDTAQARIVVAGRTVATGQPGVSGGCLALRVGDITWDRGEA
jgi:hypothetical protein